MRRSAAPSQLFKRAKLEVASDADVAPPAVSPSQSCQAKPINHLQQWDLGLLKPAKDSEEESSPEINKENMVLAKKNFTVYQTSLPVCFAISFVNTNRTAKKDQSGDGIMVVKFDRVEVYNMLARVIDAADISREPQKCTQPEHSEGNHQKVFLSGKKNEVFLYPGNALKIKNKFVNIKFKVAWEEFQKGSFFLKGFEQIEKEEIKQKAVREIKFRLAAAMRQTGGFVVPWKGVNNKQVRRGALTEPLHDPSRPNAVVLFTPKDPLSPNKIPVVVDPIVGDLLRPHQVFGVKFLFDCVMGFKGYQGNGCILADDMGLGKTLQAITLIWTLMNQGPRGLPAVKRVLIVCPSSLVGNWCKEFNKWLGEGKVNAIPFGDANKKKAEKALAHWKQSREVSGNVLVASYDQYRIHVEKILKTPSIDLVVCDEGHRLKNAKIKISQALNRLPTRRRIILSGTPIQNDLDEFHAMVDFVNPGILRDQIAFNALFAQPILQMRTPDATPEERMNGRARSLELSRMTGEFILRRTSQVNKKYLPAKVDHVVFCRLTTMQQDLYKEICRRFRERKPNDENNKPLALMTHLKKLCNTPALVYDEYNSTFNYGPDFNPRGFQPEYSGKMQFVVNVLRNIRALKSDKVVIVSNYTQTLEVLASMCMVEGWKYFQLDGSTKVVKRQELVDIFNDPASEEFIFLLSSKAGGCGLNLVGANHLIMLDPDWNPANDAQAMARVWRPGQQKRVYLYRTLCTGTVEEKIFQRQIAKLALADQVVNSNADAEPEFDDKELRDLFGYRDDTLCETHDLLNCRCAGLDNFKKIPLHKRQAVSVDELRGWEHVSKLETVTQHTFFRSYVSFVFLKEADPAKEAAEEEKAGKTPEVKEVALQFEVEEDAELTTSTGKKRRAVEEDENIDDNGADLEGFVAPDDEDEEDEMQVDSVPAPARASKSTPQNQKKRKRDEDEDIALQEESDEDDGWVDGENASEDEEYDE